MKRLLLLTALIISIPGCRKSILMPIPDCANVILLSEKYSKDSVYLRCDTIWKSFCCGPELELIRKQPQHWYLMCADMSIEHWYYLIAKN